MTKTALGRGFDGLIPVGFNVDEVAVPGESIKQIAIDKIHINPDQPRKHFDDVALEELASSIKQHGIIQPLVVTPVSDGYRIVAGERRYRASKLAKLAKLPVIVRNHQELEELEIALVENVQR
ncbi:MAG TPA: ParB/RepB/Spo0J family partition protein, partial [Candidatus Saccharibacteria bacterium]|nr:ParB/RepB/Spo0J family partition protein [Candidatus Saccharibacteria bacterium]